MVTPRDLGWLAAFLEGEGHFRFQPNRQRGGGVLIATADQKQSWPLDRLKHLLGGTIYWRPNKGKGIHVWCLRGGAAAGLMMTVYAMMSPYRKSQIACAMATWKTHRAWGYLTHCRRGHPYSQENTMLWADGYKRCRTCDRELRRRRRLRLLVGGTA